MAKPAKSQWDFGELFSPEATRLVLSVSELTAKVRQVVERQVGQVWVNGEVSNLREQSSGHMYFTLKDAGAQLNCVLFRGEAMAQRGVLEDGQKVILQGEVTVYEARGQYQLIVRKVELQGVGALQLAFERLKRKLQAEGLFAPERKRALPEYPQRIGLVTSPTGAAIRDVLHVIQRRNPGLEIIFTPCRVQGDGAAAEIAEAIRLLNEWAMGAKLDLILITRGGGSVEDLWAFNEEVAARAIFESAVPVVSAVGHEIDFTIADFVADVRAATPSAAAEIITEGVFASRQFVAEAPERLRQEVDRRLDDLRGEWEQLADRLMRLHPRRRMNENLQRLDDAATSLVRAMQFRWREHQAAWQGVRQRLARLKPGQIVAQRREELARLCRQITEQARHRQEASQGRFEALEGRLRLLSPENVLARGYSITRDEATGKVIRAAKDAKRGQRLKTRVKDGEIRSVVEDK